MGQEPKNPAVKYREEAIRAIFLRILNLKTECPVWHPVEAQGRKQLLFELLSILIHRNMNISIDCGSMTSFRALF